jgi:hypothetical protein
VVFFSLLVSPHSFSVGGLTCYDGRQGKARKGLGIEGSVGVWGGGV